MECCFRIAFGIFFLMGHLQANPIHCGVMSDLGIDLLQNEVSCGDNATFSTPTNVLTDCCTAALKHVKTGLEEAYRTCSGNVFRIDQTLETLERMLQEPCLRRVQTNSSECEWNDEGSRRPFREFVNSISSLVQLHLSIKPSAN